jgi:hypothetical protein
MWSILSEFLLQNRLTAYFMMTGYQQYKSEMVGKFLLEEA